MGKMSEAVKEIREQISFGKIAAIAVLSVSLVATAVQVKANLWSVDMGPAYSVADDCGDGCGCGSNCGGGAEA